MIPKTTTQDITRILVVSDTKGELDNLRQLLVPEFGDYLETIDQRRAIELFIRHHPSLLILAFRDVDVAETFHHRLYDQDGQVQSVMHQTLLVCRGVESEKAYRLYKAGVVDDFVADRPLMEPYRIRLSVAQALKRRSQARYTTELTRQFDEITDKLGQFEDFMRSRLAFGGGRHEDTIRAFNTFTDNLASDLRTLEDRILKGGKGVAATEARPHFDHFREQTVERGREQVLEHMQHANRNLQEMNAGLKSYTDAIREKGLTEGAVRVLVVDDDEVYREVLAETLREAGMRVLASGDGATALASVQRSRPDVILLDYKMPGIDGVATLRELKANPYTRDIPVVMLTGVSARDVVAESVKAGAKGYVVKPSDRKTILAKVHAVTGTETPAS